MKTEITTSNKDNVAISTILIAALLFLAGGLFTGNRAVANHVAAVGVQKMETIVITAPRVETVKLEMIVVSAPREVKIVVASR